MVFQKLNNSFYLAPSAEISISLTFSNIRLYLQATSELHFAAKWSKMTFKSSIFTKISNKILYFIPTSFDKFFGTGQFEEKTNSVHCIN